MEGVRKDVPVPTTFPPGASYHVIGFDEVAVSVTDPGPHRFPPVVIGSDAGFVMTAFTGTRELGQFPPA